MTDFDSPLADYADYDLDCRDVAPDGDGRFRFEVTGDGHVDITFVEPLQFHQNLADNDHQRIGLPQYRPWSDFVDDRGYLLPEHSDALVEELKKLTGITSIEHEPDSEDDEEPSWAVSIRTDYSPGETVASWHARIGWPTVATIVDVIDPGTFNTPYLFSAMLYR